VNDYFGRAKVDRFKSILYESPMVVHINRNILMHADISQKMAMFSRQAVMKAVKLPHLRLNSTTPIGILNELTWHMLRKHLYGKMWFDEVGAAGNGGLLYYSLPNDIGLPGYSERDICNEFYSVIDILDVS
jgi:hypothetical protein